MGRNAQRRRAQRARMPHNERAAAVALQYAAEQAQRQADITNAYQSGYLDGYMQALDDLQAKTTVAAVAHDIIAVHHDPLEQAKYVMAIAKRVMTPRSIDALLDGLKRATAAWMERQKAPAEESPAEAQEVAKYGEPE